MHEYIKTIKNCLQRNQSSQTLSNTVSIIFGGYIESIRIETKIINYVLKRVDSCKYLGGDYQNDGHKILP